MELSKMKEMLQQDYPEKIVVDISEFENEEHQTYKYLYEQLNTIHTEKMNELGLVIADMDRFTRENAEMEQQINKLQQQVNKMNTSAWQSLTHFKDQISRDIVVSDIQVNPGVDKGIEVDSLKKSISTVPGIYGGKRPSWYTPLKRQLSRENVKKKNVGNTIGVLKDILLFWKKEKGKTTEKLAAEYDQQRKENILELLDADCSNEEKYLKYFLLTPGMDREYLKTLQGASKMNINANLVIALSEQPYEMFNKEIIELYVSEIHKGTEYDLKQELAEELIRGDWSIRAKVDGEDKTFQLVPVEELEAVKTMLDKISNSLDFKVNKANGEVCAKLAQTSPDSFETDNVPDDYFPVDEFSSSVNIEFDDSMLGDI